MGMNSRICGAIKANGQTCNALPAKGQEGCRHHPGGARGVVEAEASVLNTSQEPPVPEPQPSPPKLINLGRPSNPQVRGGGRTVKMLVPQCEVCQSPENLRARWWEFCEHEPYISKAERTITEPILEEQEDGTQLVKGHNTKVVLERSPNLTQITLSPRVNVGIGVERRRKTGAVDPETKGFAPFCQYRDCWSQNLKVHTDHGSYCRPLEAKLVIADATGKTLEVHDQEKRAQQLQEMSV